MNLRIVRGYPYGFYHLGSGSSADAAASRRPCRSGFATDMNKHPSTPVALSRWTKPAAHRARRTAQPRGDHAMPLAGGGAQQRGDDHLGPVAPARRTPRSIRTGRSRLNPERASGPSQSGAERGFGLRGATRHQEPVQPSTHRFVITLSHAQTHGG